MGPIVVPLRGRNYRATARQPSVHDRFARPIVGRSIYMPSRNGMIDRLVAAERRERERERREAEGEGEERNVENAGFSLVSPPLGPLQQPVTSRCLARNSTRDLPLPVD